MRLFCVILGIALLAGCGSDSETGDAAPATSENASSRRARGPAEPVPEDVDLQALLKPVPEYEGRGRNLFDYGAERAAASTPPTPSAAPPTPRAAPPVMPPRATTRTVSAPTARINVKYAGFLEKTETDGKKAKYAIFLDGNEILAAAEGEDVGSRFKVVEIGLESVTIEPSAGGTQRIPLQAN